MHTNVADYLKSTNYKAIYLHTVTPENDPEREPTWNGPWYPTYGYFQFAILNEIRSEMMIQCISPVYGRNDQFLGGILVTLSMSSTSYLLEQLESTPGGRLIILISTFNVARFRNAVEWKWVHHQRLGDSLF